MKLSSVRQRTIAAASLLALLFFCAPVPAYALQSHGYKGLYVHQGAHFFFIFSMLVFIFRLRRSPLAASRSWRWMSRGAWLLFFWNVWALSGHFLELLLPDHYIVRQSLHTVPLLRIESWKEVAYYFLKMDHLLSVPAALCFCIGLKGILVDFQVEASAEKRRSP